MSEIFYDDEAFEGFDTPSPTLFALFTRTITIAGQINDVLENSSAHWWLLGIATIYNWDWAQKAFPGC